MSSSFEMVKMMSMQKGLEAFEQGLGWGTVYRSLRPGFSRVAI